MRPYGVLHPTDLVPAPPDTVQTFLLTGGSSAQGIDWQTSTGAVANAGAAGVHIARFTGMSTAGTQFNFMVNLFSTGAIVPTSGTSVSSSGVSHPVYGQATFQIPGGSTGYSVAALSSGNVVVEQWHK